MARIYRRNLWQSQRVRVEVWLEKDALAGVIVDRTAARDVPLMVSPGQSSDTFLYTAATTAKAERDRHRSKTVVLTMYDYDLSGERCHEAVRRKLTGFYPGVPVEVHRLALTEQQVADWNLPTLPAKEGAGKWKGGAVELDAAPPDVLQQLVHDAIAASQHVPPDTRWHIHRRG